jgi:hypothetical protein
VHDDDVVPELLAYRHKGRWKAFCRWCDCWHHWFQVGVQPGRCPVWSPLSEEVRLIDSGDWSPMQKVVRYRNHKL